MIRIATPPDLNSTTRRFPRTLDEAFLCDAEKAQAIFRDMDVCSYGGVWWACMALLAIVAVVVIVATA